MKVGDVVYSTKTRPNVYATIESAHVKNVKNKKGKVECRTTYKAKYEDGSTLTFYGFDINRSIFKVEEDDGQISLFDIYKEE